MPGQLARAAARAGGGGQPRAAASPTEALRDLLAVLPDEEQRRRRRLLRLLLLAVDDDHPRASVAAVWAPIVGLASEPELLEWLLSAEASYVGDTMPQRRYSGSESMESIAEGAEGDADGDAEAAAPEPADGDAQEGHGEEGGGGKPSDWMVQGYEVDLVLHRSVGEQIGIGIGTDEMGMATVAEVVKGSAAERSTLQLLDRILMVNGKALKRGVHLGTLVDPNATELHLRILRLDTRRYRRATADAPAPAGTPADAPAPASPYVFPGAEAALAASREAAHLAPVGRACAGRTRRRRRRWRRRRRRRPGGDGGGSGRRRRCLRGAAARARRRTPAAAAVAGGRGGGGGGDVGGGGGGPRGAAAVAAAPAAGGGGGGRGGGGDRQRGAARGRAQASKGWLRRLRCRRVTMA